MNRDHLVGRLKQFNGKLKEQWCELHGDHSGVIAAKRYQIASRTQAQCGIAQQEAAQQLRTFRNQYRTWRLTTNMLPAQSQPTFNDQKQFAKRKTVSELVLVKNREELLQAA